MRSGRTQETHPDFPGGSGDRGLRERPGARAKNDERYPGGNPRRVGGRRQVRARPVERRTDQVRRSTDCAHRPRLQRRPGARTGRVDRGAGPRGRRRGQEDRTHAATQRSVELRVERRAPGDHCHTEPDRHAQPEKESQARPRNRSRCGQIRSRGCELRSGRRRRALSATATWTRRYRPPKTPRPSSTRWRAPSRSSCRPAARRPRQRRRASRRAGSRRAFPR